MLVLQDRVALPLSELGIYGDVLLTLEQRKVKNCHMFAPVYISSWGMHCFNIYNKEAKIYEENNMIPHLPLHSVCVGDIGTGKSFMLKQMYEPDNSMFAESGIPIHWIQQLTDAGWVGTVTAKDGEKIFTEGIAETFKNGIGVAEEMHAMLNAAQMSHSKNLDNTLLTSLDKGKVVKKLANGLIEYDTNITLHGATQPARFELASGLGRRFIFMLIPYSRSDRDDFRRLRRAGRGLSLKKDVLNLLNVKTIELRQDIMSKDIIQEIDWCSSVDDLLDEANIAHFHDAIYERFFFGYNLMTKPITSTIKIVADDECRRMFKLLHNWRVEIESGVEYATMLSMISSGSGFITEDELIYEMMMLGWNNKRTTAKLRELIRDGRVEQTGDIISFINKSEATNKVMEKLV